MHVQLHSSIGIFSISEIISVAENRSDGFSLNINCEIMDIIGIGVFLHLKLCSLYRTSSNNSEHIIPQLQISVLQLYCMRLFISGDIYLSVPTVLVKSGFFVSINNKSKNSVDCFCTDWLGGVVA